MQAIKAFFGMKSSIKPTKSDLTGIDTFVIASPVWAGKVPPYVNAYLGSVMGGNGKPFHVLIEMGGRGDQSAIAVVRKALERKGMTFVSSASTIEKDVEGGSFITTLEKFAAGIRK
jgi:flavorubredoxin